MIYKSYDLFTLLDEYIRLCRKGRRLQKNGRPLRKGSIENYHNLYKTLREFSISTGTDIRIREMRRGNKREREAERRYWKRFYFRFTEYLYRQVACYDNYVGSQVKLLRSFFNYLEKEKLIETGGYHRSFYVRKEEVPVLSLSPEQLNFLISEASFAASLPSHLLRVKDLFVFGCTTGLRYSDLVSLRRHNLESVAGRIYLKLTSRKTSTFTRIRLPSHAVDILSKYKGPFLLPKLSLQNLNKNSRTLCARAGWTQPVEKVRCRRGKPVILKRMVNGKKVEYRFCDLVSSHTMRRTAITVLLSMGVPELVVRRMSGHSTGSREFYRYVNYSQAYLDQEADKAFKKLYKKKMT